MSTSTDAISFFVPGVPAPGGSKRAFVVNGRAVVTDDCKRNKPWRQAVTLFAADAYHGDPLTGPLVVEVVFTMPRPKSHYRTGKHAGVVRDDAPAWHTKKPDATKLLRALEDALTGVLWTDDAVIAEQRVDKVYGNRPGAYVTVWTLKEWEGFAVLAKAGCKEGAAA